MLSSISWQQYLAAVAILTISYYLFVILRYYQSDLSNFFHPRKKADSLFTGLETPPVQVMGQAKSEDVLTIEDPDAFQFGDITPDEEHVVPLVSDPSQELVLEAGDLINAFTNIDNKPEFLSLLKILISSYQRFGDTLDLPVIYEKVSSMASAKLRFKLTRDDLQAALQ